MLQRPAGTWLSLMARSEPVDMLPPLPPLFAVKIPPLWSDDQFIRPPSTPFVCNTVQFSGQNPSPFTQRRGSRCPCRSPPPPHPAVSSVPTLTTLCSCSQVGVTASFSLSLSLSPWQHYACTTITLAPSLRWPVFVCALRPLKKNNPSKNGRPNERWGGCPLSLF